VAARKALDTSDCSDKPSAKLQKFFAKEVIEPKEMKAFQNGRIIPDTAKAIVASTAASSSSMKDLSLSPQER